jgi:DNA (cytosine-5)-methyltransferase 1
VTLTVGSLFSGIGGFELGLERAGMRVLWQAETDPYASAVLAKHWPGVRNHGDVRNVRAGAVEPVDVICGGFPCQDISNAGKRAGIDGERSGLWSEYARIVGELRPRYVIVENVAALLGRGIERVLGDLAALGFDAEWHCIPASAVGAPHRRDRVWIIAYARGRMLRDEGRPAVAGAAGEVRGEVREQRIRADAGADGSCANVADANSAERQACNVVAVRNEASGEGDRGVAYGRAYTALPNADCAGLPPPWAQPVRAHWQQSGGVFAAGDWWRIEPDVGRVAHGVPSRVDRLRCLGNAIVPQVAEIIGKAVVEREEAWRKSA